MKIPPSKKDLLKERARQLQREWRQENYGVRDPEQWRAVLPWELVTCKRCQTYGLCWTLTRSGKWMLIETFAVEGEPEIRRTSRRRFHDCPAREADARVFSQYPEPAGVLH